MQDDFSAGKEVEEAKERGERAGEAKFRGILLFAAILAVVGAIASLFSNQFATAALQAKNEAILHEAQATDVWNLYEARSIKQHIYEAVNDAAPQLAAPVRAKLKTIAGHEKREQSALSKRAKQLEADVENDDKRSEDLMRRHEILEASVTFFEVAIAIVSIAGITATRWLVGVGGAIALGGLGFFIFGFLAR